MKKPTPKTPKEAAARRALLSVSYVAFDEALPKLLRVAGLHAREAFLAAIERATRARPKRPGKAKIRDAERAVLRGCKWVRRTDFDEDSTNYLVFALLVCHAVEMSADRSRAAAYASMKDRESSRDQIMSARDRLVAKRHNPRKIVSAVAKEVRLSKSYVRRVLKES
jgi:hypothetical protein